MRKKHNRKNTLFKTIFFPVLLLLIFQSVIFYFATVYGGIVDSLNQNASDILKERVINRENELETQFNSKWTKMETCVDAIQKQYSILKMAEGKEIYADKELQKVLLAKVNKSLVGLLRSNNVNGVFFILNNQSKMVSLEPGESQQYYGLCIRDYDQNSGYTDREDIQVLRCPSSMISDMGCSLDSAWEALYTFDDENPGDYYFKPMESAYENPGVSSDNLAYFMGVHHYSKNDKAVVSYSLPLMDERGYPYAVLGVELTTTYLESLLPSEELHGHNQGSYALVQYKEGESDYRLVAYNGILYQKNFGTEDSFSAQTDFLDNILSISSTSGTQICGGLSDLAIYNKNTPFEDEKLALVGMVEEEVLYAFSAKVRWLLFMVAIGTLAVGALSILLVSHRITIPVRKLANKVRKMDGQSDFELERIQIDEIDELVNALEEMNQKINKNQVRSEFFSRMSHDMRTPMNAIIGFSSTEILENASEEKKDEYLSKIQSSGIYLLGLINEVLDMTKIDSEKIEIHENALYGNDFWKDTVPIIEEVAKQKGIHFEVDIEEEDCWIYADRQRLSQIFVNLLSNAVKFTPESGTVTFKVEVVDKNTASIVHKVTVKDTGIGMSKEFQKRLYQPFTQEHEGVVEGTGLGLSITKKLVELMGGSIECCSEPGKGTEFVVIFTNRIASKEEAGQREISQADSFDTRLLNGKRILLCEDHPLNIQIARKLLEKKGIIVEEAVNGEIGVEYVRRSRPYYYDGILMDIRMPQMNGIEATKAIRALDRDDVKTIPIIAMTANAFEEDVNESHHAGMNAHLSKPIEPEKLYQTLAEYLVK